MTQNETVLADLRQKARFPHGHTGAAVCGSIWLGQYIPRYAARISDLRSAGYKIHSGWCKAHRCASYWIEEDR